MIGVAMTAMLHADDGAAGRRVAPPPRGGPHVSELIADWKRLFPTVVAAVGFGDRAPVLVSPSPPSSPPSSSRPVSTRRR
jgi:hypothetical protein